MDDKFARDLAVCIAYALKVSRPALKIKEARRYQAAREIIAHLQRCRYRVSHEPHALVGPTSNMPGPEVP